MSIYKDWIREASPTLPAGEAGLLVSVGLSDVSRQRLLILKKPLTVCAHRVNLKINMLGNQVVLMVIIYEHMVEY